MYNWINIFRMYEIVIWMKCCYFCHIVANEMDDMAHTQTENVAAPSGLPIAPGLSQQSGCSNPSLNGEYFL